MKVLNYIVYAVAKAFLLLGRFVPLGFTVWWMRGVARLLYRVMSKRRRLIHYNLEQALGATTTPEERQRIGRESFENLFISFAELLHMDQLYPRWQEHFRVEGGETIDRLIAEGKGFFVFGGHFGGWTSMASVRYRFPDCPGYNIVARPQRNPRIQQLIEYLASQFGGSVISTHGGTGGVVEERIRQGHLVGLYMDQESRRDKGIFVKFFGRDACSHVVPAYLAWKNDIPMIPYWVVRERPGYFHVIFRAPLKYEITDDPEENNRRVTQLIADEVERTIREHPEQWLWAHNRWRRRPDGTKIEI
jgi:Kdo2-lipid IVA lauroyltransferase/acyltransferase